MTKPNQPRILRHRRFSRDLVQADNMEVLCACDERYLPHASTMLCSLLEHNSVPRIHFFCSSVPDYELEKLKSFVTRYQAEIIFYEIDPAALEDLYIDKWASMAVYYRLLAPRLLPINIDKVLYLDSDIVVRGSLADLWNTNLTDHAVAAVPDYVDDTKIEALGLSIGLPVEAKYFNSGVLLINLKFWRQNNVAERAIAFARNNPEKVKYWDQDALNATLICQWIELPAYWNWQDWRHRYTPETGKDPAIVHFISADRPWHWSSKHPFRREYHKYRRKTPWWNYQPEGRPRFGKRIIHSTRRVIRSIVPKTLRKWLRSRLPIPQG
jgi:lipopolysaccharide biosynthesis glycosyltransferase